MTGDQRNRRGLYPFFQIREVAISDISSVKSSIIAKEINYQTVEINVDNKAGIKAAAV